MLGHPECRWGFACSVSLLGGSKGLSHASPFSVLFTVICITTYLIFIPLFIHVCLVLFVQDGVFVGPRLFHCVG
jgi:hypothetical protein